MKKNNEPLTAALRNTRSSYFAKLQTVQLNRKRCDTKSLTLPRSLVLLVFSRQYLVLQDGNRLQICPNGVAFRIRKRP